MYEPLSIPRYFNWLYDRHNNDISTSQGNIDLQKEFPELTAREARAIFNSWTEEAFV